VILYYGDTCPHCEVVEQHIKQDNLEKKVKIIQKEVFKNLENATELTLKAKECGLASESLGVPFAYYKSKCFSGDQEVLKLLNELNQ